jgi:hypothetical protein
MDPDFWLTGFLTRRAGRPGLLAFRFRGLAVPSLTRMRNVDTTRVLAAVIPRHRRPLLVTGAPRSGTTWLARQLAGAPGCAMTGREPMNPKPGQYRLGGTLEAWTRLDLPTRRQRSALRLAYAGLTPRVYGAYGHRQWAAPWPGTRTVVKDPFAVLSVGAVVRETAAVPVLVYRHPAAVLASYRRMHWLPDVAEVATALEGYDGVPPPPAGGSGGDTEAMAWFWSALNTVALHDLASLDDGVVVSHEELAAGGSAALRSLFDACGLVPPTSKPTQAPGSTARTHPDDTHGGVLHRLDRPSDQVATAWRASVGADDLAMLDELAGATHAALAEARLRLA